MASRLVVALACFALCHSRQVNLNGYVYRDGRSFSLGQAYGGNRATGSASINGGVAQAYGSASNDNQYTRNGYGEVYPGQLVAQAEAYENPQSPYGSAKAVAQAQNAPTYYAAVPAPATIVSYEQNFEMPSQGSYQFQAPGAISAQSTSVVNDNSESSVSSVSSDGSGSAQSSAQTGTGIYGVTSTKANTFGSGAGSASSNANTAYGSTVTSAKSHGYGVAASRSQGETGLTSAQSQSNGGFGSASSTINNAQDSVVTTANSQGFGSATSNANINNIDGPAITAAKTFKQQGTGWRFGLLYGTPQIQSIPSNRNALPEAGSTKTTAHVNTNGFGTAQSTADAQGSGILNARADINGGYVHPATQYNGYGLANSAADIGYGSIKSTANSHGAGHANANADVNAYGAVKTTANTNGFGSATSTVNNGPAFATFKSYVPLGLSRSAVNAQTSGTGSATSSVSGHGYRMVNSSANSSGYGTAHANAQSL